VYARVRVGVGVGVHMQAQSMLLAAVRVGRNRLSLIDAYFKQK
jgi:hypothetical protein